MPQYLDYINFINQRMELDRLPDKCFILYHALLKRFNKTYWRHEWIAVDNLSLMADIGAKSEKSLLLHRDKLIAKGFIAYKRGKKGSPGRYKLLLGENMAKPKAKGGAKPKAKGGAEPKAKNTPKHKAEDSDIIKDINNKIEDIDALKENNKKKAAYGEFSNVYLTGDELEKLKRRFSNYKELIERLSTYIESKGAKYKSHYATILAWAKREQSAKPKEAQNHKKRFNFTQRDVDYSHIEDEYFESLRRFSENQGKL